VPAGAEAAAGADTDCAASTSATPWTPDPSADGTGAAARGAEDDGSAVGPGVNGRVVTPRPAGPRAAAPAPTADSDGSPDFAAPAFVAPFGAAGAELDVVAGPAAARGDAPAAVEGDVAERETG
jgi:hypothetical protein